MQALNHARLLIEQIRIAPGPGKLQFVAVHAIEQQSIWLDVKIVKPLPGAFQRMITIGSWK